MDKIDSFGNKFVSTVNTINLFDMFHLQPLSINSEGFSFYIEVIEIVGSQ